MIIQSLYACILAAVQKQAIWREVENTKKRGLCDGRLSLRANSLVISTEVEQG